MALIWHNAGGSATGGTGRLTTVAAGLTAQTSVTLGEAYAFLLSTQNPAANQLVAKNAILTTGNRISMRMQIPVAPGVDTGMGILVCPTGSGTALFRIGIDTNRNLRLYTNGVTTQLGATGSTVVPTGTPFRITLSYSITTTTNWSAKVYIDGALEMTRTNADGTLSSAAPADLQWRLASTMGNDYLWYFADIYVDDTADQTDPGNVRVTAKLPTTTTTNNFDGTTGTGAVNERPISTTNGRIHSATGDVDQDYDIQTAAVGAADLTGATIIGYTAWVYWAIDSTTGTPLSKIIHAGARNGTAIPDPGVTTALISEVTVTTATYPRHASNGKNIGLSSTTIAANTRLHDCGVIISYIPSSGPPPVSLAGSQPTATGVLSRLYQALRALVGNQPTATGVLTRTLQALRALAGSQPSPTGELARIYQTTRSLTGSQPTATGTLEGLKATLRDLAGNQPAPTGVLTRLYLALRSLAGDQPTATGVLSRLIAVKKSMAGDQPTATGTLAGLKATFRDLAGSQPSPTGVLTRLYQALRSLTGDQPSSTGVLSRLISVTRSLAGNQPAATGTLARIKQALRSLAGNQPTATGTLAAVAVTPRRAIVTWLELEAPFAIRTLTGSQPSPTGALARIKQALRSLAGNQPTATGVLTRLLVVVRALAGNQPTPSGILARLLATFRALAGNQPVPSGTLVRLLSTTRALAGNQPAASGSLARVRIVLRSLTGDQPAPSASLTRLLATTRLLVGDEPAPTGELSRQIAVTRTLDGDQPSPTGVLTGFRNLIGTGHGRVVLRERSGNVLVSDRRSGNVEVTDQ